MEKLIVKGLKQNSIQCSGHTRPVVDLHFNSLIKDKMYYVISASKDGVPMLRFGHTGDWIGSFKGHKGAVWSCTLNSDGSKAATGAADFTAKVWDCENGKSLINIDHNHIVRSVEFSTDANQLVTATNKHVIEVHDLQAAGKCIVDFKGHKDVIHRTLWFAEDKKIISVSKDKTIRLWDVRTGSESWSMTLDNMIYDMDVVGNKLILACGNEVVIGNISPNDTEPVAIVKKFKTETKILSASLHPSLDETNFPSNEDSHNTFVCGGEDLLVYKYNIDTGMVLDSCKAHFGPVHCVRYSPDGHLFASGSEDGTLRLWQNVLGENYGLWYLSGSEKSV